jgi:hypothetical protein
MIIMQHGNAQHSPQTLRAAFAMHIAFVETGDMHTVNWECRATSKGASVT